MRACRPLLGTYVEIRVADGAAATTRNALEAGFAAIAEVQRLMSVYEENSDISRIARLAHHEPVAIAPWTRQVIELAQALHAASGGLFDCGIAPRLAEWGLLPETLCQQPISSLANLYFTDDGRVRCSVPTCLDLGGIAKGFAVDRAVEALQSHGARGGQINAGGDLRVFGDEEIPIHLRDPGDPEQLHYAGQLRDGACATSATYYSRRRVAGREVSALVDPRSRQPLLSRRSYTVIAPSCAVADALTKVLALSGDPAHPCFSHFHAHPLIIEPSRVLP